MIYIDTDLFNKIVDKKQSYCFPKHAGKNIITWEDLENYLNNNLQLNKTVKLFKNALEVPIPYYKNIWSNMDIPDSKIMFNHINDGCGFIVHNASKLNSKINNVCYEIENNFRQTQVDVHVYAGLYSKSGSFLPHWDYPDNFIIQQDGQCEWTIYKNFATDDEIKNNSQVKIDGSSLEIDFTVILSPGDILYIPGLRYHYCKPLSKRISISIPVPNDEIKIDRIWHKFNTDK